MTFAAWTALTRSTVPSVSGHGWEDSHGGKCCPGQESLLVNRPFSSGAEGECGPSRHGPRGTGVHQGVASLRAF